MRWQPYHKDSKPLFQGELGLRVHWFGRYGGYPKWSVLGRRLGDDAERGDGAESGGEKKG